MLRYFRPKPGRHGYHPAFLTKDTVGTITANQTNKFRVPCPYRKVTPLRLSAACTVVGADADGALLAYLVKYDASADAEVTLSNAINLEALVTREVGYAEIAAAATPAQLTLDDGDCLEIHVVSDSAAINTQPTDLCFCVEVAVLE